MAATPATEAELMQEHRKQRSSVNNTKRLLRESLKTSEETNKSLVGQTEQLQRIEQKTDVTGTALDTTEWLVRSMRSTAMKIGDLFGAAGDPAKHSSSSAAQSRGSTGSGWLGAKTGDVKTSAQLVPPSQAAWSVDARRDGARPDKMGAAEQAGDKAEPRHHVLFGGSAGGGDGGFHVAAGFGGTPTASPAGSAVASRWQSGAGTSATPSGSQFVTANRVRSAVEEHNAQIDDDLDDISNMLSTLKTQAVAMNGEIHKQGAYVDRIDEKVESNRTRLVQQQHTLKRV